MIISMKTNTLQIRAFPIDINKTLKIAAVAKGVSFREFVIAILKEAARKQSGAAS
jgi:plasmid stability protein